MADTTAEVLRLVRRRQLNRSGTDLAYRLYLTVFLSALVVPSTVVALRDALSRPSVLPEIQDQALEMIPAALAALILAVLWSGLQDSALRGPFRLDVPIIDWVARLPVRLFPLVAPAFLRVLLLRASCGAIACCLLLLMLWRVALPMPDASGAALTRAGMAGALLGVLSAGLGVLSNRTDRLRPLYYLLFFGLVMTAAPEIPAGIADWSGPWGWASQLIVGSGDPELPLVLLTLLSGAALVGAIQRLPVLELHRLRPGSQLTSGLRSGMWLTDSDWLYSMVGEARRADFSPRGLRVPGSRSLLVPWRDLQGILRNGPALARALPLVGLALICPQVHIDLPVSLEVALAVLGPLCLYFAMTGLMGGARACVSDPGRARYFFQSPSSLALAFGIAPLVVLVAEAVVALVLLRLLGAGLPGMLWVMVLLPAVTVAALVGVYRGVMPSHLMLGFDTPFGNSAPLQMATWHASGVLGLLCVAGPVSSTDSGVSWASLIWILLGTAILTAWARQRGRRVIIGLPR